MCSFKSGIPMEIAINRKHKSVVIDYIGSSSIMNEILA